MPTVHLICGATGAGKTTHALKLARATRALRLSIDPWMQTLFAADQGELNFAWMMARIGRCEALMWQLAEQVLALDGDVVLDLGFSQRAHRDAHRARAQALGAQVRLHFVDTPMELRRARVDQRNRERDPELYAFEVTPFMFDFMEPRFERPDAAELADGQHITS